MRRQDLPRCDTISELEAPTRSPAAMLAVMRYLAFLRKNAAARGHPPDEQVTWKQKIEEIEEYYGLESGNISIFWMLEPFRRNILYRFPPDPLHQV